jgi:hypothetical protein
VEGPRVVWYLTETMKGSKALALVALALVSACSKETPPAAEEARSPTAGNSATSPTEPGTQPAAALSAAPADAPAPAAAQAKFSDASFDLVLAPKGDYKAGQAGEVEIALVAKAPFHVNDKYPYKFKAKEGSGIKFAAPVTSKEALKLETMKATMTVAFTPEAAGKHELAGQFSFSVCTDDKCLIEKRDLALEITAN